MEQNRFVEQKNDYDFPECFVIGPLDHLTTKKLVELKLMIENILEQRVKAQNKKENYEIK